MISQQESFAVPCAILLTRFLSIPALKLAKMEIPNDVMIAALHKLSAYQTIPELNQVIQEEAGQYIILLSERKSLIEAATPSE